MREQETAPPAARMNDVSHTASPGFPEQPGVGHTGVTQGSHGSRGSQTGRSEHQRAALSVESIKFCAF